MDSTTFITAMPSMDIFAHQAREAVPGTEKSMLRRQKAEPERHLEEAFDSDDFCDFGMEDNYFSRTYAPLSCLPTPPMSSEVASPFTSALEAAFEDDEDNDLLGKLTHSSPPSCHVTNLNFRSSNPYVQPHPIFSIPPHFVTDTRARYPAPRQPPLANPRTCSRYSRLPHPRIRH